MTSGVATIELRAPRPDAPTLTAVARVDPSLSRSVLSPETAATLGLRTHRRPASVARAGRVTLAPVAVVLATVDGDLTEPLTVAVSAELAGHDAVALGQDWLAARRAPGKRASDP